MERRDFLKFALGAVAGAAAFAASATAAPLMPQPLNEDAKLPANPDAQPAVTSKEEAEQPHAGRSALGPWPRPRLGSPPRLGSTRLGLAQTPPLGLAPPPLLGLPPPLAVVWRRRYYRRRYSVSRQRQIATRVEGGISRLLCFSNRRHKRAKQKPRSRGVLPFLRHAPISSGSVHSARPCRRGTRAHGAPRRPARAMTGPDAHTTGAGRTTTTRLATQAP